MKTKYDQHECVNSNFQLVPMKSIHLIHISFVCLQTT